MRVGVLGLNHKLADLTLRERLAKSCQRRLAPGCYVRQDHSFVLLSTCNRTEIYFSSEELSSTHSYLLNLLRNDVCDDFDQKLYSYFGQDCLQHLCKVTAGLDSAILAETEIQGQVKNAYESAQEYHKLPFELHYLFQKSLGIAKKVRSVLPTKPGLPDIEHAILQLGQHFFNSSETASVLFIGASDINEKILEYFNNKGLSNITLCNRSEARGRAWVTKHQTSFISWDHLREWHHYDWIIVGTKAPSYLINQEMANGNLVKKKLIIDLSVPRNVDPWLAKHPMITLLNIDQINRLLKIREKQLLSSVDQAEQLINDSIARQFSIFQEKAQQRLRYCASAAS